MLHCMRNWRLRHLRMNKVKDGVTYSIKPRALIEQALTTSYFLRSRQTVQRCVSLVHQEFGNDALIELL